MTDRSSTRMRDAVAREAEVARLSQALAERGFYVVGPLAARHAPSEAGPTTKAVGGEESR